MRFRVLGPLELSNAGSLMEVHGTKQGAALGYLLFNVNRVVSTSELLDVLWPTGETPNSARKILHNAIWGLRGVLTGDDSVEDRASLTTRPPGYVLQLEPRHVDLHEFRRLAACGHAQLGVGEYGHAAGTLAEALGLWRGAVLADLVEAGFGWPELAAVESTRINAKEDYFDAELGRGRHHGVLREIEATAEQENLRERLCGQLMLALYRSGRQTDALDAYNRMRARLVDDLGLEPGMALQGLQSAILRHDAHLRVEPHEPVVVGASVARQASGFAHHPETPGVPRTVPGSVAGPAEATTSVVPVPLVQAPTTSPAGPHTAVDGDDVVVLHREVLSVLMAQASVGVGVDPDPVRLDRTISAFRSTFQHAMELLGGSLAAGTDSSPVAWFPGGVDLSAAERAVSAALAVLGPAIDPLSVRAAVATGEAVLFRPPGSTEDRFVLSGPVADDCQALLARTAPGTARACATTRELTAGVVTYGPASGSGSRVRAAHWQSVTHPSIPILDRGWELDVLDGLIDRCRHRDVSQLVTLLGDAGVGKTRLVRELERRAIAKWDTIEFLTTGPGATTTPYGPLRDLILTLCAVDPGMSGLERVAALRALVTTYVVDLAAAEQLIVALSDIVAPTEGGPPGPMPTVAALAAAAVALLRAVAADRPVVLFVDDAHELGDPVLDFLSGLTVNAGPPALMVIVASRPDLIRRRPDWGGGHPHASTITLTPLSNTVIDRLADMVASGVRQRLLSVPTCQLHSRLVDEVRLPQRRAAMRVLMLVDSLPDAVSHTDAEPAPVRCTDPELTDPGVSPRVA